MPKDQYILRMMIRGPGHANFQIPPELEWIRPSVELVNRYQDKMFDYRPYVYVTVRSGIVSSTTDDVWHVDGFSTRVPHVPEQNYIWSDKHPTEVLDQTFSIPSSFDPLVHNIHQYFQDRAHPTCIHSLQEKHIALIDPYVVHRRPWVRRMTSRCFFRISFLPIEIEDDTCTPNPLLPRRTYNRPDIRKTLVRYVERSEDMLVRMLRRPDYNTMAGIRQAWLGDSADTRKWIHVLEENNWDMTSWLNACL